MERYIVDVNNDVLPPPYLEQQMVSANGAVYQITNGLKDEDAKVMSVPILRPQEWPSYTDFNLDESQFEAFRAALTKQIVVIQGPPGNGP